MSNHGQSELAGIVGVRARMRGWPISTTGMSSTSRGLHFDVRDASHGIGLIVPACDHHAMMVALGSSRQFTCETYRRSREVSCRAGDFIVIPAGSGVRLAGGIPPMLRIGIEPDQLRQESILGEAIRGEDDQTRTIRRSVPIRQSHQRCLAGQAVLVCCISARPHNSSGGSARLGRADGRRNPDPPDKPSPNAFTAWSRGGVHR